MVKKISVMIVDDEKLAIDDLLDIVDWEDNGYEVVATAINGKQAISKFQRFHPQVVLTDIKMPYMDGIEFIKRLREIDTKTKILLLTAYKDFAYAKSAIQYGITDYIIKSDINSRTFKETLLKLREVISSENKASYILKQKRISDFLNSNMEEEQLSDKDLFFLPYCYLIIEQDLPINISGDCLIGTIRDMNTDVISVLMTTEEEDCTVIAASSIQQDKILLVLNLKEVSETIIHSVLYKLAESIKIKLSERFEHTFTVYVVDIKVNLIALKRMYLTNEQLFFAKYLIGNGRTYNLSDCSSEYEQDIKEDMKVDENLLTGLIEKMDGDGLQSYIDRLFDQIFISKSYTNLYRISRGLYLVLRRHNDLLSDIAKKIDINANNNWIHWLNGRDIKRWFGNRFSKLINEKKRAYESGYSKVIARAIDFINKHYSQSDLAINRIADDVHLSTGHLCSLFKKETGKTVNSFITEVRMSEAKRMLKESNQKVYEISSAVGYQSSQYFSQVFYKLTGVYPAKYQKGKHVN